MLTTERINGVLVVSFNNVSRFNALIAEPVKEELKKLLSNPNTDLILNLDGPCRWRAGNTLPRRRW